MSCLVIVLICAYALSGMAFLYRRIGKNRVDRVTRPTALKGKKDDVSSKEKEFQAMLDDMLRESRENIAKKGN